MTSRPQSSPARELAAATAALVRPYDITDILANMLQHVLAAVEAEAAAILVAQGQGALELLSSTSHTASDIEIYQAQTEEGPCIECLRSSLPADAYGESEMTTRWPSVGPAMIESGYQGVHAQPLLWHGRTLGGLNIFFKHARPLSRDARAIAQAFADMATLSLVQTQQPSDRELSAHITLALEGRTLVEQAKGVLMQVREIEPGDAYQALRTEATQQGLSVTEMARSLVWRAHEP